MKKSLKKTLDRSLVMALFLFAAKDIETAFITDQTAVFIHLLLVFITVSGVGIEARVRAGHNKGQKDEGQGESAAFHVFTLGR